MQLKKNLKNSFTSVFYKEKKWNLVSDKCYFYRISGDSKSELWNYRKYIKLDFFIRDIISNEQFFKPCFYGLKIKIWRNVPHFQMVFI